MSETSEMPKFSMKKEGWLGGLAGLVAEGVIVLGGWLEEVEDTIGLCWGMMKFGV